MKSVHAPEGLDPDYVMRPTIRLLDRTETDGINPLASAMVEMRSDGRFLYEIGPLLTGMYDVAFSCPPYHRGHPSIRRAHAPWGARVCNATARSIFRLPKKLRQLYPESLAKDDLRHQRWDFA